MTANPRRMDAARFGDLAEAYGGDLSRWPDADREAAAAWLAGNPLEGSVVLEDACALDDLLETWRAPGPAESLRSRVLAPAPAIVRSARRRAFVLTLGGGAGLAAACLAGILVAPFLLLQPAAPAAPLPIASITSATPAPVRAPAPAAPPGPAPIAVYAQTDEVLSEVLAGWEAPVADTEADPGA